MGVFNFIRKRVSDWLKIEPSASWGISIKESCDFPTSVFVNKIWHRGDANELSQLYHQLDLGEETFWGSDCSQGQDMRKIHTGLPRLIVNSLTNIAVDDLSDIVFEDKNSGEIWTNIETENKLQKQIKDATKHVLALGDGAFKISYDIDISQYPIVEFYNAENVDFKYEHGRLREVIFYTHYQKKNKTYTLKEIYGYGHIEYILVDEHDKEIPLTLLNETAALENVYFNKDVMFAIPYIIHDNEKFKGRGQSIFDGKLDAFDSFDEVYSQWIDAFRSGKTKTYIPDVLLPRDPANGNIRKYNPFDTRYIATGTDLSENAKNQITTVGGDIKVENYIQTYSTALDLCLQGIISPSTLGIDIKKLDNGEAQREKEKATLYTRSAIISALTEVIDQIIIKCFNMLQIQLGGTPNKIEASFSFGEYANPSFESVIETMSNPNTPMSIEAKVEEIWGDSKDENWKAEEVARIKAQSGIIEMDEPAVGNELTEETE